MTEFSVQEGNVVDVASDLLLLKHAQGFFGADQAVASRLISARLCTEGGIRPLPGDSVVVETLGSIAPKRVLFLGTPPLYSFTYDEMYLFAQRAIEKVAALGFSVRTITTTIHGTGYGLDGGEALQRLVRGFREGLATYREMAVESIIFLTLGERAERMLKAALTAMGLDKESTVATGIGGYRDAHQALQGSVTSPAVKDAAPLPAPASEASRAVRTRRVFVAMPFSEEFQNVYEFGIYPAVRNAGFICERVDETHFTGDILNQITEGIAAASLVIADLTEGRPNVYLEVGYAWGRGVPVIFVARKGEKLHFDVSTHRCIFYGRFTQFARDLEELIRGIEA
jgi:hypothetical protein